MAVKPATATHSTNKKHGKSEEKTNSTLSESKRKILESRKWKVRRLVVSTLTRGKEDWQVFATMLTG
jgi:hypothetical protein